jgi:hypothetical protein
MGNLEARVSGREMPHATGEGSGPRRIGRPATPALQSYLSDENPARVAGPIRNNATGGYSPRESQPK